MLRRMIHSILLPTVLAIGLVISSSGCYGSFALAKKVHTWNGEVSSSKWVQWLVFVGMVVVPVYEVSLVVNALVLNTIEFYSGSNPVGVSAIDNPDGSVTVARAGRNLTLRMGAGGALEVWDGTVLLGHATQQPDGGLVIYDSSGHEIQRVAAK